MKMGIKERRKLSINNKKHIEEKQDTLLQFRTFTYYRNRHIRSYHKNYTLTKKRIDNI